MSNRFTITLFFIFALSCRCLANHGLNALPDEKQIAAFFAYIIGIHLISIFAYLRRILWLRVVCGILYIPVLVLPYLLSVFSPYTGIFIFLLVMSFYIFVIVRKRK